MKVKDRDYYTRRMQTQLGIIRDLGYTLDRQSVVLDLGCGNGNIVKAYRDQSYQAYGCDFNFKDGPFVSKMKEKGIIRQIDSSNYTLPFDDNSVDFVISDHVFEHVKDYPATLHEVHRILKPGGISLHFFPSRYVLIEPHVHIPFASVLQNYYWLRLWALLGIRTREQKGLSAKETADRNYDYLSKQTIYLTKSEITSHCARFFGTIRFCEDIFIKYIQRVPMLYKLSKVASFLPVLYSTLRTRVLFFSK
jgi:ubiquinone/menaquinone biosynthesis C-methylase UbiE